MTSQELNSRLEIRNVAWVTFKITEKAGYYTNKGFAFYIEGLGYLKFKNSDQVYMLDKKRSLQAIKTQVVLQAMMILSLLRTNDVNN